MPVIYDNIDQSLLPAIRTMLGQSRHADFCVGYFNLRGWRQVEDLVEDLSGANGECYRLLIGMQPSPSDELRRQLSFLEPSTLLDNPAAQRLRRLAAAEFREQLAFGLTVLSVGATLMMFISCLSRCLETHSGDMGDSKVT